MFYQLLYPELENLNTKYKDIDGDVQYVKGIGPRKGDVLKKHGIKTVRDLLFYIPRKYLDRTQITKIGDLAPDREGTVLAEVESYGFKYTRGRKRLYLVNVTDRTGILELIWFRNTKYLDGLFEEGDVLYISGKTGKTVFPQMAHPEFEFLSDDKDPLHTLGLIPMYPTTAELKKFHLDSRGFRRIIREALGDYYDHIGEDLPENIRKKLKLQTQAESLHQVHFPESEEALERAKKRMAFAELFYMEIMMAIRRHRIRVASRGIEFDKPGALVAQIGKSLPFKLTSAQRKALGDIYGDMTSGNCMRRLLQGDVGSGKTIVAALASALAIENGYKAAIMVPTEVLAEQHYINMKRLFADFDIEVILLTGNVKDKTAVYDRLAGGKECLIIGTHALIQSGVNIYKLGLAVIDEQHRFGVRQRVDLIEGNRRADLLVMTATPIPRTLAMTMYGDFDYSIIDEMPPGRLPVKTMVASDGSERQVFDAIMEHVRRDEQVYVVYPLVEISEKQDLQAAVDAYEKLKHGKIGECGIGLLHGRMSSEEKEQALREFSSGKIKVLISTTVIEVGIDSPNATLMVVIGAERFGLSQLHQLRGRVGRGKNKSTCILKLTGNLSDEGKQRIQAMEATNDGFRIAEFDLQIRGPGEFFGTRQHGFPEFKFADITGDYRILDTARKAAFDIIEKDPKLSGAENRIIYDNLAKYYSGVFKLTEAG
ncbi:MAG: ATP-dependent DNA helicase RecG [candidate division Zixibacteria bacterium]|nr:ATP-dependent DNA helicase RecG [candidate division Zixibacteria bacterium]